MVIELLSHSGRRTALGTDWTRKPSSRRRREQPCQSRAAGERLTSYPAMVVGFPGLRTVSLFSYFLEVSGGVQWLAQS